MSAPFQMQIRQDNVWFTVSGEDFDEFYGNLSMAVGAPEAEAFVARFRAVQNLRDAGMNPQPVAPPASPAPADVPWEQGPATPPAPPAPPAAPSAPPAPPAPAGDWKEAAPQCAHGRMRPYEGTYRSGRNAGKTYRAYFCAASKDTPREQKCSTIDAATGKPWG